MNHQLREGEEGPKRQIASPNSAVRERYLTDDSVVGDEIDPAEPEEFGVDRRDNAFPRP
jgi:hypothetical protein